MSEELTEALEMNIESVSKVVVQLPQLILLKEKKIIALNRGIDSIQGLRKRLELQTYKEVSLETEASASAPLKLVSKFSNEKLREAETSKRLDSNVDYAELYVALEDKIIKSHEEAAELNYLKNQMKSVQILTDLLKIRRD